MPDVFSALNRKKSSLLRQRYDIEEEAKRRIAEVDRQIADVDQAIGVVNGALEKYLCPVCNGTGNVRRCDAAGDMEDATCGVCKGTGIKPQ